METDIIHKGPSEEIPQLYITRTAQIVEQDLAGNSHVEASGFGVFQIRATAVVDTGEEAGPEPDPVLKQDSGLNNFVSRLVQLMGLAGIPGVPVFSSAVMKKEETEERGADLHPESTAHAVNEANIYPNLSPASPETIEAHKESNIKSVEESFFSSYSDLSAEARHPYLEWAIVILLLSVLVAGLFYFKPSFMPDDSIERTPFRFSDPAVESPETIETTAPTTDTVSTPKPIAATKNPETIPSNSLHAATLPAETPGLLPMSGSIVTPFSNYTVQPGDNCWTIAKKQLKNPFLWPVIYRANLDKFKNPDQISPGVVLTIPEITGDIKSLSDNDLYILADGYFHAYFAYKKMGKSDAADYLTVAKHFHVSELDAKYQHGI